MKKILSTLILISLLAVPVVSLAATTTSYGQDLIPNAPFETPGDFIDAIDNIGNWIFTALLVLAAIFMVVAGYFFVMGGGEPEKLNKARTMLINALIGVAVAVAAKGFIKVVEGLIK